MRGRLGRVLVVALLAAGCAVPGASANRPAPANHTDVWFLQHMTAHQLQTTSIAVLTRDRICQPKLRRLVDTINRHGQAHLTQLQGWLDRRGLAPADLQQAGNRQHGDLGRLEDARGKALDLVLLEVMTARLRAASRLAAAELREGNLPEVRQLARQLLAEQQAQVRQLQAWKTAWSKAVGCHPPATAPTGP
jgi:uncharacterized protein (DUF305 family)